MLTAEALQRTQRALADSDPDRCFAAIDALGWDDGEATVMWPTVSRRLGHCHIGPYPTAASIARSAEADANDAASTIDDQWWRGPYYRDYRWSIEFAHGRIRYCDLLRREECEVLAADLSIDLLRGLTPTFFADRGTLTPIGAQLRTLPGRRGERAAHEFCTKMFSWLSDYLAVGRDPESMAKERFTRILSAFILLRTIEDVGRLDWLGSRSLLESARRGGGEVQKILTRAAHELNSRVLHGVSRLLPEEGRVRNLIESFYGEDLDFAALEADPVGQFYQNILGTQYNFRQRSQGHLWGENRDAEPDGSVRKKRGAYFTPREYADLIAKRLVLPAVRNARTKEELPVVLDLAVGSGQLLCAALRQIFSIQKWRTPDVALHVLKRCMWAVDSDPNAPQLAALNVLRTTVQLVPGILGSGLKFPSLVDNFIKSDSLKQSTINKLPEADVVLLNPPFHGAREWVAPTGAIKAVKEYEHRAHSAFAFCIAALEKLRPGGDLGVLLPAQPISGIQYRQVRAAISQAFCIETVIVNEVAEAFGSGEQSYTSIVLGHRDYGDLRPMTQVITVAGEKGADIGALAAGAWKQGSSTAHAELVALSGERAWDWTGEAVAEPPPSRSAATRTVPRISLRELLGTEIHQPVSCAPKPWQRDLFLFEVVNDHLLRNIKTRTEITFKSMSPLLRPVVVPNFMMKLPPFVEPRSGRSGKLRVFFPADGSPEGLHWRSLFHTDRAGYDVAKFISDTVLSENLGNLNADGLRFRGSLDQGIVRISWNRGYSSGSDPIWFLTQSANPPLSARNGLIWPSWIDTSGKFVPLGGNWARVSDRRWAVALAVLLNVPTEAALLLRGASTRGSKTTQPSLKSQNAWQVPDLRQGACDSLVSELQGAFDEYRMACALLSREAAVTRPEWVRLISLGEALWRL